MPRAPEAAAAVTLDELTVAYGDVVAVDRVTLRVEPGHVYGLLGPNGAGKTSIIRALTTVLRPSGGSATVAGAPLTDPARIRAAIGVLPESNGYPNASTARELLVLQGELFGADRRAARSRADELLDLVGLSHVGGSRIGTYSRGMRQRLGIARALVNRPAVLFLDEPTLGLDPAGKAEVLGQLEQVVADDSTVVLCSHLLDDVERICDRVGVIHQGRLVADGTVADVAVAAGLDAGASLHDSFLRLTGVAVTS